MATAIAGSRWRIAPTARIPRSPGGLYCPIEQQKVTEDVDAAYVMLKFGGDDTKIGNVSVRGNIGVRFVTTECHGHRRYPVSDLHVAPQRRRPRANRIARSVDPDAAGRHRLHEWRDGAPSRAVANNTNWLPSLNLRFGLTDDQFIRFAASRAMARPDMGLYKNYIDVGAGRSDCARNGHVYDPGRLHQQPGCV